MTDSADFNEYSDLREEFKEVEFELAGVLDIIDQYKRHARFLKERRTKLLASLEVENEKFK